MAAGYIIGGQCLDEASAGHFYTQSLPKSLTFDGTSTHMHVPSFDPTARVGDEFQIRHYLDGAFLDYVPFSPTFTACDTSEAFLDGTLMGWGVLAAMAAAWGIKQMGRALS